MDDLDLKDSISYSAGAGMMDLIPFLEKEYGVVYQEEKEKLFNQPDIKFMTKLARRYKWRDRFQRMNFLIGILAGAVFTVQYFVEFTNWPNLANYFLLAIVIMTLASGIGRGGRSFQKKELILRLLIEIQKKEQENTQE